MNNNLIKHIVMKTKNTFQAQALFCLVCTLIMLAPGRVSAGACTYSQINEINVASTSYSSTKSIGLVSFTAVQNQKEVIISWSTATELNNEFFTVEKSVDGVNFIQAGTVNGAGTSELMRNYSFTDKKPTAGICYYRLAQTNFTGEMKVYPAVPFEFVVKESFEVSPNPTASHAINIRILGPEEALIVIHNERGLAVFTQHYSPRDLSASQEISFEVPAGEYYVNLVTTNSSEIKKVLVLE